MCSRLTIQTLEQGVKYVQNTHQENSEYGHILRSVFHFIPPENVRTSEVGFIFSNISCYMLFISNGLEVFCKKASLKNFSKFAGLHPLWCPSQVRLREFREILPPALFSNETIQSRHTSVLLIQI